MEAEAISRPRTPERRESLGALQASTAQPVATLETLRNESTALVQAIIAAANDPSVNIEKMERLLAMHERIAARDAERLFNAAMRDAQSQMGRISADAINPQTRSQYATYGQLDRHVRPIYTASGFSLSFDSGEGAPEGHVRVLCYVSHAAGHTRTHHADMPADGKGARGNDVMTKTHASGSAMSYGMRYLLKLIFNIAVGEDDDDGNGGQEPPTRQQHTSRRPASRPPKELLDRAYEAADGGRADFGPFWAALAREDRNSLRGEIDALQARTEKADANNPPPPAQPAASRPAAPSRSQPPVSTLQGGTGTRSRAPAPRR